MTGSEFPWSTDELAAAIAILNHANIRSSRGAASLIAAAKTLAAPGDYGIDILRRLNVEPCGQDGVLLPLADVIEQLQRADPNNRDLMLIFGVQPASTIGALIRQGSDSFRALVAAVIASPDRDLLLADTRRIFSAAAS